MKLIANVEKKTLRILENERSIFRGEYGADKLELYINKQLENEYPTITALLSNGRKIGPYSTDDTYITEEIDGEQYTKATFTLSKANGFTLSEGKMQITIWMNNINGNKQALGNVILNVINTTAFDDGDIIVSGDVEGTIVNYKVELENLQGKVNGFNATLNSLQSQTSSLKNRIEYVEQYKAEKTEIPTKLSQLEQDVELGVSEEDVMDIVENNSQEVDTISIGSSNNYDETSDNEVPTTKAVNTIVSKKVADLVNSAPEKLDTLSELSKALNNDENFANNVLNKINGKVSIASPIKQPTHVVNGEEVQLGAGWNDWDTFIYAYSPKGKDSNGNLWFPNGPQRIKISQGFNPDSANSTNGLTIVQRVASGAICAADPSYANEVTTKQYVEKTTVAKITTTADNVRVYTINPDGTNSNKVAVATSATASTIVMRNGFGQIVTETPTNDNHATTKKYVDDLVGDIQTLLEAI